MFYIKQFFKITKENSLKGFLFLLISISFVLILGNWSFVKEKILNLYPDYMKGPSFYALISSSEDHLSIQRKLISLPGISSARILDKDLVNKQAEKIINNYQLKNDEMGTLDFIGLEVMFDKNINERGQELIRNYLIKLAGENNITLGKTNYLPEADNIKVLMDYINNDGIWIIGLLFGGFWIFSLMIFKKEVKKASYLIEQFQRKRQVEFKILFSGIILVYFLSAGLIFLSPTPEWVSVFLIGIFFSVVLIFSGGKRSWGS
jgi:hypothetical protein